MATYVVSILEALIFTEDVETNFKIVGVVDTLAFHDGDRDYTAHASTHDVLPLVQSAVASGNFSRAVSQNLAFEQDAGRTRVGYAYQNLTLVQSNNSGKDHHAGDSIGFLETATGDRVRHAGGTLVFTETVTLTASVRHRSVTDTLVFVSSVSPFVDDPRVVSSPVPTVAIVKTTLLTTPAGSIVLPAPDFGNAEELGQTRIERQSRGGTFIVFRPSYWPTTDEFSMTFSYLDQAQVDRLRYLIAKSVGVPCSFLDHEGHSWAGIVTSPDMTITQVGRFNYTANFKFLVAS